MRPVHWTEENQAQGARVRTCAPAQQGNGGFHVTSARGGTWWCGEGRSFSLALCYLGRPPCCGLGHFLPGEACGSSREHDSLSLCPLRPCISHPKTPRGHLTSSQPSHPPNSRDRVLLAKPRRCHACSHHRAFAHAVLAAWDCQPPGGTWWLFLPLQVLAQESSPRSSASLPVTLCPLS